MVFVVCFVCFVCLFVCLFVDASPPNSCNKDPINMNGGGDQGISRPSLMALSNMERTIIQLRIYASPLHRFRSSNSIQPLWNNKEHH